MQTTLFGRISLVFLFCYITTVRNVVKGRKLMWRKIWYVLYLKELSFGECFQLDYWPERIEAVISKSFYYWLITASFYNTRIVNIWTLFLSNICISFLSVTKVWVKCDIIMSCLNKFVINYIFICSLTVWSPLNCMDCGL